MFSLSQVQCDTCHWWLHYNCSNSGLSLEKLKCSPTPYQCQLCRPVSKAGQVFFVVKRTACHKVCRGCGKFGIVDNYIVKHVEKYNFYNKNTKKLSTKVGNRFYHADLQCINKCNENVTKQDIILPDATKASMSVADMEKIEAFFG